MGALFEKVRLQEKIKEGVEKKKVHVMSGYIKKESLACNYQMDVY